jgi:hypothetical protein
LRNTRHPRGGRDGGRGPTIPPGSDHRPSWGWHWCYVPQGCGHRGTPWGLQHPLGCRNWKESPLRGKIYSCPWVRITTRPRRISPHRFVRPFVEEVALGMVEGPLPQEEAAQRCGCTPDKLCPGPVAATGRCWRRYRWYKIELFPCKKQKQSGEGGFTDIGLYMPDLGSSKWKDMQLKWKDMNTTSKNMNATWRK